MQSPHLAVANTMHAGWRWLPFVPYSSRSGSLSEYELSLYSFSTLQPPEKACEHRPATGDTSNASPALLLAIRTPFSSE